MGDAPRPAGDRRRPTSRIARGGVAHGQSLERDPHAASQLWRDLSSPFFGANRPGSTLSQGTRDEFWLMGMAVGLKAAYDCIEQFSETDFNDELTQIDVPTLLTHGDDDQIVPIGASAQLAVQLIGSSRPEPGAEIGHRRQP